MGTVFKRGPKWETNWNIRKNTVKRNCEKLQDAAAVLQLKETHGCCGRLACRFIFEISLHYAEVEKLGSKWSTLNNYLSTNFEPK